MNSELYDKKYPIPLPIIGELKAKLMTNSDITGEGVKRAKFLVKNGYATYQMMKRIKNFFDHFDMDEDSKQEFELSGGEKMRNFIESSLNTDRDGIDRSKELQRPSNPDLMVDLKPQSVTEAEEKGEETQLNLNANIVVVNNEKRFLLLKRSTYPDQWHPNEWCLPGGAIEEGETPIQGALRELKEETGIVVKKFKESFVIQRDDNVEHVFLSLYEGDPFNIKLGKENQGYGWFGLNEIKFLDTVPNLMDYINITLESYD